MRGARLVSEVAGVAPLSASARRVLVVDLNNFSSFPTLAIGLLVASLRNSGCEVRLLSLLFLDLKLNSNPAMLRGISENIQSHVPGAEWIGTVHVDQRLDNGLSRRDLRAAVASGMRRISFGLETGSQRLLDQMKKGSLVEANAGFIREAYEAGLSVRCTMMKGYPGETADDLLQTAEFLEEHSPYIDRVRFNEFSLLLDTPAYHQVVAEPSSYPDIRIAGLDGWRARGVYRHLRAGSRDYRRAKARVLRAVYEINRRRIRSSARAFDGLM